MLHKWIHISDLLTVFKKGRGLKVVFSEIEQSYMIGGELFHNHPRGTLSDQDVFFVLKTGLKKIHAITESFDYCLTLKGLRMNIKGTVFSAMWNDVCDEVVEKMMGMNSRIFDQFRQNAHEFFLQAFASAHSKDLGLTYDVTSLE